MNGINGKKKYTSVGSILNLIPGGATQHDVDSTWGKQGRGSKPCDLEKILPCLTTSGSDHYHHPAGHAFTHRELAAIQGFFHRHTFIGHCAGVIKRQIGNAVPPMFAKILFESIRKQLETNDAKEKQELKGH